MGSVARLEQVNINASNGPTLGAASLVGFDGLVYFENMPRSGMVEVRSPEGQLCRASVTYPETTPSQVPTIGPIPCTFR